MAVIADLEGRDLDRVIAKAMGWKEHDEDPGWGWLNADGQSAALPRFRKSLDALSDGPERVLREAGWTFEVTYVGKEVYSAWFRPKAHIDDYADVQRHAPTEALARARAVLAALLALNAERKGEASPEQ